jgi:hypothetical protein
VAFGVAIDVGVRMAEGVVDGVAEGVAGGVAGGVAVGLAGGVAGGVAVGVAGGVAAGVAVGLAGGVAFGVAFGVMVLRPEAWLLGRFSPSLARVTPLPLPGLRRRLRAWLEADWEAGLRSADQFLRYSLQFIPVVGAVNDALALTPSQDLLPAVSRLADSPYDWDLLRYASAPLANGLKKSAAEGFFLLPQKWRSRWAQRFSIEPRLDTPAHAAAAAFWYLHEGQPEQAAQAFAVVRHLPHGESLYRLATALARAAQVPDAAALAALGEDKDFLQITLPPQAPLLHPAAWQAVEHLRRAAQEALAVQRSVSRAIRSQALNRALGEVVAIEQLKQTLPDTERDLTLQIAAAWRDALLALAGQVGQAAITQPVRNPYVVGDPVIGAKFAGREDIMRRLEELWRGADTLPSVALYGHRRMGKTSILRNLNAHLGAGLRLAYFDLQRLGEASRGPADLFLALADAVQRALQENGRPLPPPDPSGFDSRPYRAFEQFLERARQALGQDALLIALDEFEKLEDWIAAGVMPPDLLGVLRGYVQMDPRIAFVFAGLHTLQEMSADYFQPFFGSVIPVPVTFLRREAVFQALANPGDPDFPLDYTPDALQRIWELTHGQPYLVQWIGHSLVSRFNDLTFERSLPQKPLLDLPDVEAVIATPDFYTTARYYFSGVWDQAARGAAGQQDALRILAPFEQGLPLEEIASQSGLSLSAARAALETLRRHDVVEEVEGRWRFTVELMRRWVSAWR